MSKQSAIRKGLVDCLGIQVGAIPNDKVDNCYEIEPYWKGRLVTAMLDYLNDNGVVIKVDDGGNWAKGLPPMQDDGGNFRTSIAMANDMQEAGYVAVEPLIDTP